MACKKGFWRCAVNKCGHEGLEAEFKSDQTHHVCPKCKSEDVFPSDDGNWPENQKPPLPDPFDFED